LAENRKPWETGKKEYFLLEKVSIPVLKVNSQHIHQAPTWALEGFFHGSIQLIFPGVETVMKFSSTNSKLREKHFSNKNLIGTHYISKSRGAKVPSTHLSDAHVHQLSQMLNTTKCWHKLTLFG